MNVYEHRTNVYTVGCLFFRHNHMHKLYRKVQALVTLSMKVLSTVSLTHALVSTTEPFIHTWKFDIRQ